MTQINDHEPKATPDVMGTVVTRPRETDAIGGALACVFGVNRVMPPDMMLTLGKLNAIQ